MRTETPQPIHLKDYQPSPWLIDRVELDVRLDPVETRVVSRLAMRPNPKSPKPGGPIVLDGEALTFGSASLDGAPLKPEQISFEDGKLTLADIPSREVKIEISSTCNPQGNSELSGLYLTNGIYCTQCEAEGFRRITYFPDRPDVLARLPRHASRPTRRQRPVLLSNGNLGRQRRHRRQRPAFRGVGRSLPEALLPLRPGRRRSRAVSRTASPPSPAARSRCASTSSPARSTAAPTRWTSLKRAMRWDEEAFGREYDLDLFMIVAVRDFNMGAMENKGLNVFNSKYVLAEPDTATDADYENIEAIIAHEYFHNWTGNRITCRDWFQLCLKEGLTVFRDQEFSGRHALAARSSGSATCSALRAAQFPEDAGPLAHPVRPELYIEINNFYTATVYEKGAEVIRMLQDAARGRGLRAGHGPLLRAP